MSPKSKRVKPVQPPPIEDVEGHKIEARLGGMVETALRNYMRDRHLENRAEVCKSALGQLLEREGYLIKTVAEEPGNYKIATPDPKKIGFHSLAMAGDRRNLLGHRLSA